MKTIKEIDITGKKVFVRVDFNVPLDDHQNITDDTRIQAVLPTLRYILDNDSKLIIASHLGRPDGKITPKMSLSPVAKRLGRLLKTKVVMAKDCIGSEVEKMVNKMKNGDVVLLENLRFHPEEQKNDEAFAKKMGKLCDVYINDAFGTAHRAHASTAIVAEFFPERKCYGLLLSSEIENINKVLYLNTIGIR